MDALIRGILGLSASLGATPWAAEIARASARCGVPVSWIERIIDVESGGRTHLSGRPIRSSKGAIGLMQLMPATWAEMRVEQRLGSDPDDPADNILAGACYLRKMYELFGYPGLFAAYNAGPRRYADAVSGRRRLPSETRDYLAKLRVGAPRSAAAAMAGDASGQGVRSAIDPIFAIRKVVP